MKVKKDTDLFENIYYNLVHKYTNLYFRRMKEN